ncbi:MAG: caspase family protein, partial [Candidatus Saccharibacteria bacterium]|nr:caspase family protein [Rhodoferax sp.]
MPTLHWLSCLFSLLFFCLTPAQAQGNQRVALLIGNATYTVGRLTNPPNDVREMQTALQAVGFKVQIVLNANQNQMKRAVRDFGAQAQGADVAFLYYSGHATQARGENYLIPVQASIDKESDYEVEAVSANTIMAQIVGARPKAAIVVLDACRDNPLAATTRSASKGLGRMEAPTGTMIAFATAPNT